MAPEPEISLGELWRTVQGFKHDLTETRQDTQRAIGKVETAVENVRDAINNAPYVHQLTYEERSKANGERVGLLEREVADLKNTIRAANSKFISIVLSVVTAIVIAGVLLALGLK